MNSFVLNLPAQRKAMNQLINEIGGESVELKCTIYHPATMRIDKGH